MKPPRVEFQRIEKSFFGTRVLKEVSFSLGTGQTLGLVGENGAGKSTLANILAGILPAESGRILLRGEPFAPDSPDSAAAHGVAMVHQELNLFPNLSIAENLFLADLPRRGPPGLRWIRRRELLRRASERLRSVRLEVDPALRVEALSPGERQLVEIARSLGGHPEVLVLDEPTTYLSPREKERLFSTMKELRERGTSIIYISHNLGDVLRLSDEIVVLRDGEVQATRPRAEFDTERLISLMVGRELEALFPRRSSGPGSETVLEARGLSRTGVVADVNFCLRRGEVLGISGLMGSGRTELARLLFGLDPFERGEVRVGGRSCTRLSPRASIRRGLAFLTEDRHAEGLFPEASLEENLTLTSLRELATRGLGLLRRRRLRERARELARSVRVEYRSLDQQTVRTLSGGNQQKVVLGRWLAGKPRILILDEPTRGVDVGARHEIYVLINELVAEGASVILISSEMEELVGLCDRILVMARGEVQGVVERGDFDRHEMLRSAFGEERLR